MKKNIFEGPILSVSKALFLLEEVGKHPAGASLSGLTEMMSMDKSSVFRLLETLEKSGFIVKDRDAKAKYRLGLKLFRLGRAKMDAMPFRRAALPFLKTLRDLTGETAAVATKEGDDMFFLETVESGQMVRCGCDIASDKPEPSDAFGSVLLGELSAAESESRAPGLCTIAAAVRDNSGKTQAALGVLWPACRHSKKRETELLELALRVAKDFEGEALRRNY
jgi:DNA-binding IclR family transcriptional regulator